MRNQLHKVRSVGRLAVAAIGQWCAASFDKGDVFILVGLGLVVGGLSLWSRPLALIVPGALLLWVFLPARPPFIETAPPANRVARRPPS